MQNLFGTDGIRARVGTSPLTPTELTLLGSSLGAWIAHEQKTVRVIIGHDTRHSSSLLKAALKTGLLQYPVAVTDAGITPTPALFHTVNQGPYDIGIMITASHNPHTDNGLKIFTKSTGKVSAQAEQIISDFFYNNPHTPSCETWGTDVTISNAADAYVQAILAYYPTDFLKGITLVVDCAHGAYSFIAPAVLEALGATVITLSNTPNGKNINNDCGSLFPEHVQRAVRTAQAHAGFAFDGDGDRLIAIGSDGSIKDGDELLAFLLQHPAYKNESAVVGTVLSNQGLQLHLEKQNKVLHRTPVGDKNVLQKMKECGLLLGAEPSGHIITRDFTSTADGLFTLLRIAQTASLVGDWTFTSFKKFPQVIINVPIDCKKDLSCLPYAQIVAAHQQQLLPNGRLIVRYSGTEPLLRVMVEASTEQEAHSIGNLLSQELVKALSKE